MVTEKIKAAAHQVAAMLSGKAGILNTLEREHAEVSALMQKVLSSNDPISTAEEHYPAIRKKLLVHARAEQDVLYTACEKRAETASMISTSIGEHAQLERLIGQLDHLPVDSQAFLEEFRRLEQSVRHHVEQEENLLFDRCQEAFEGNELRDLDREYDDAKTLVEGRLTDAPMMRRTTSAHPPTHPSTHS
jgi:hemerythrin superfamily protein